MLSCMEVGPLRSRDMASQTSLCGDGNSFERVDIDCSMAFRMVESTIRRIMREFKERKGDDIVFAGLINSDDGVSVLLNSQHRSSKFLSSIPAHVISRSRSSLPQNYFLYSSSTPLFAQPKSVSQELGRPSLPGSPQPASTPFEPSRSKLEENPHSAAHARTSSTSQHPRGLRSTKLLCLTASAVPSPSLQASGKPRLRVKSELEFLPRVLLQLMIRPLTTPTENTFSCSSDSRIFCSSRPASSATQRQQFVSHSFCFENRSSLEFG